MKSVVWGMRHWLKTNQGIGVALCLLSGSLLLYLYLAPWASREMRDGFTLGFFPILGTTAMLACALVIVVDVYRNDVEVGVEVGRPGDILIVVAFLAACYVFFLASSEIGFLLAAPVFLFGSMQWLGLRPWPLAAGVAVAMSILIYAGFTALGIQLPSGPLPF